MTFNIYFKTCITFDAVIIYPCHINVYSILKTVFNPYFSANFSVNIEINYKTCHI